MVFVLSAKICVAEVSILVLVDLALEYGGVFTSGPDLQSFNPCFSGSCIGIRVYTECAPLSSLVSILVLVDLALE